jgi:tetratricopeptide (TPR) repeat protein
MIPVVIKKCGLRLGLGIGLTFLGACASVPPEPEAPPRTPEDVKLTLNLPEQSANCTCEELLENDRTFLERGMETLADGDYIEAVQYFQRYQRLEKTALAHWEGELAIAYVSILPSSPFFDVDAALVAYTDLQAREPDGQKHHSIVLMQQALESFVLMERHVQDLERRSTILEEDLEKREQALKRLRELTLGQPED